MTQIIFYNQTFNSRAAVFESFLRGAGNITEAPPVADEARRCWRKTRGIAPAPRAIGDYVLRGLDGLRSKMHEPVLFERSAFACECAEQLTESRKLCTAGGVVGDTGEPDGFHDKFQFSLYKSTTKIQNSRNSNPRCGCKFLLNYRQSVTFFQKKSRLS